MKVSKNNKIFNATYVTEENFMDFVEKYRKVKLINNTNYHCKVINETRIDVCSPELIWHINLNCYYVEDEKGIPLSYTDKLFNEMFTIIGEE